MRLIRLTMLLLGFANLQAMAPKAFALARYNNPKNTALIRHQRQGTMPQRMINSQKSVIPATIYNHWRNNKNTFNAQQTYASYATSWGNKISTYALWTGSLLGAYALTAWGEEEEKKQKFNETIKLIKKLSEYGYCASDAETKLLGTKISEFCYAPYDEQYLDNIIKKLLCAMTSGFALERIIKWCHQDLIPHAEKNFSEYAICYPAYLNAIAQHDKKFYSTMIILALQHFESISKEYKGQEFLISLIVKDDIKDPRIRQLMDKFLQLPSRNIQVDGKTLIQIINKAPCDQQIMIYLQALVIDYDAGNILNPYQIIKNTYAQRCFSKSIKLTPTEKHLLETSESYYHECNTPLNTTPTYSTYKYTYGLCCLADQFNQKQRELENQGYATFVHGQQWPILQKEEWYTFLYGLKFDKPINDFLFLHIKEPVIDRDDLLTESAIRRWVVRDGRRGVREEDREVRDRQLFLNHAFFGNNGDTGSSTADWILKNKNAGDLKFSFGQVFKYLNYEHIYQKYAKELIELENQFKDISKYGHALLIAIPRENVDKCTHLAYPYGHKKNLAYRDKSNHKTEIKELSKVLRKLDTKPADRFPEGTDRHEYCLAMTWDKLGGLNPDSGIKIFSINAADQEKLQAYRIKENELMKRIEADIRAEHDKQSGGLL